MSVAQKSPVSREPNTAGTNTIDLPSYESPIITAENVQVTVPLSGKQMNWVDAHIFQADSGSVFVKSHWKNGTVIQRKPLIIVNRIFFIPDEFLGKTISATVEVVQKNSGTNKESLILNYRPCETDYGAPSFEISFKKIRSNKVGDRRITIPRTEHEIRFKEIPASKA